jgi:hypothetical protein
MGGMNVAVTGITAVYRAVRGAQCASLSPELSAWAKKAAARMTDMKQKPKPAKREPIAPRDKRYVRRGAGGKFKESDDIGKSLSAGRRKKATLEKHNAPEAIDGSRRLTRFRDRASPSQSTVPCAPGF